MSNEHGWQHKIQEFLIEIAIIVFAVTISIWFHTVSEKRPERKAAKEYFIGLRSDLASDIKEIKSDSTTYVDQIKFFKYLSVDQSTHFGMAYFKNNYLMFSNSTFLYPSVSRFEAFKYSGKMNLIEDK